MNRWQRIALLNGQPPNVSAGKLLPPDWINPENLHVLSLALWGTQQGIYPQLDFQVTLLSQGDPDRAMVWVTECPDGGEILAPEGLNNLDAEQAAEQVLENISDRIR